MRRPFLLLISFCLVNFSVVPLAAADLTSARCQTEIKNEIAKLSLPPERIESTEIVNIYDSNGVGGGRIDRVEGWVSFTDCKGNLVVSVSAACIPLQTYTTYECRVPGVKNF
ncbi:hypothetical protein [Sneathiella litorea]|uniref:Uncharacterized protein n=1 Tax=Sneathiella litorea TaxID=2606216 RepID=A0A6L8WBH5_9PROT|nr:hypothetical protein [Sneathiella litorea]MZR31822.1 hypothetical protein [Sneathiella litorea]